MLFWGLCVWVTVDVEIAAVTLETAFNKRVLLGACTRCLQSSGLGLCLPPPRPQMLKYIVLAGEVYLLLHFLQKNVFKKTFRDEPYDC